MPRFFSKLVVTPVGILKIADEVKCLDAAEFAGFFQPLQNFFEVREVNAVAFQPHAARVDAAALEDAQKNEIRRVFDEDDVAFVAERLEGHVKQLLRTAGDDHAFGRMDGGGVPSSGLRRGRRRHCIELLQMLRGEPSRAGWFRRR